MSPNLTPCPKPLINAIAATAAALALTACGGGGSGYAFPVSQAPASQAQAQAQAPVPAPVPAPAAPALAPVPPPAGSLIDNSAPVSNAGAAQSATAGKVVKLDGSGSTDADGDTLSYAWTLVSKPTGSVATLDGADTAKSTFTPDVAGTYVASLVVNDGKVSSEPATVTVTTDALAFDSMPSPVPTAATSYSFQAMRLSSLGETITLKPGSPRNLESINVLMSSYACEQGAWDDGSCVTTPGSSFPYPVTISIYDAKGNPLGTPSTQTFSIPYRPSAVTDPTCASGQWKDADNTCHFSYAFQIAFDLRSLNVKLPEDTFTYVLSYDTQSAGSSPKNVPGDYNNLNVSVYNNSATPPAIGTGGNGTLILNGTPTVVSRGLMAQVHVTAP